MKGEHNLSRAYIEVVGELERAYESNARIMEGQESLKAQTVRIRAVLGGSTHDNPNGKEGDTEALAAAVVGENERLRALLLAVQSLVCPIRSDGFYQESIANLLADEGEKS